MNAIKVTVTVPFKLPAFGNQARNYSSKLSAARSFAINQAFAAVPGSVEATNGPEAIEHTVSSNGAYLVSHFEATFTFNVLP